MINKLCIFGVGLIGGSLALALKKAHYCNSIVGCSRDEKHLQRAVELGVIDSYTLDQQQAVQGADMIMLATPLRAMPTILANIAESIEPQAIITDAGSAKGSVVEAVSAAFGGKLPANFVAGHPIAGLEKSTVEAAKADLYIDHTVILTPNEHTDSAAVRQVSQMWQATGAVVDTLSVKQHDDVLAATSHLPHVLAFSFVDALSKSEYGEALFDYTAGGFKSFSRTAASDPVMWRDICLDNKNALLAALETFQHSLDGLTQSIRDSDAEAIEKVFINAKITKEKTL